MGMMQRHQLFCSTAVAMLLDSGASIWFENWGVVGPGLKTGGLLVLRTHQMEAHSTGLRVSSFDSFI